MLVKHSITNPTRIREGLAAKVRYLVKVLEKVHYPVAPEKIKYIVIARGAMVLPKLLVVRGLPTLQPKTVVRWLGIWLNNRLKFDIYIK